MKAICIVMPLEELHLEIWNTNLIIQNMGRRQLDCVGLVIEDTIRMMHFQIRYDIHDTDVFRYF